MVAHEEIQLLYRLVFPLAGEFNEDYLSACIRLRREIRKMCKPELRLPLLMIASALKMYPKFNEKSNLSDICRTVRKNLEDYCLWLGGQEASQMVIQMKSNALPHEVPFLICEGAKSYLREGEFLIEALYGKNGLLKPLDKKLNGEQQTFIRDFISSYDNKNEESVEKLLALLKKYKLSPSKLGEKEITYMNRFEGHIKFTLQEKEFIIYLHDLLIHRKIPYDIRVENLCTNFEVLKFKSSVAM